MRILNGESGLLWGQEQEQEEQEQEEQERETIDDRSNDKYRPGVKEKVYSGLLLDRR